VFDDVAGEFLLNRVSGTEGYAEVASELLRCEESIPFLADHDFALPFIPTVPCAVVDIGAGTGRASAWSAAAGHRVVAVEPVDELRIPTMARHTSRAIEWVDDSLPDLAVLRARRALFDVCLLTAVWMHLDEAQRSAAMPIVAALVKSDALVLMSLRHGPPPPLRRMFEVTASETITLGEAHGLRPLVELRASSVQGVNRDAGVTWTRLAFKKV